MNRLFLTLTLLLTALPALAQSSEEPEAPASLFDQQIGDVGVELEADGTWNTRLVGGWGQGFSPQGSLPGLGYPGFVKGGTFEQNPDFTLTLRLLERYYLEIIYSGTLADRSFLVGYQGQPGEFLQWAKLGNAPMTVPARAGQSLAEGRRGAPALAAAATAGPVSLELLGRYEDGTRETRTFRGYTDAQAALVSGADWIRNRFFHVPGTSGVRVLTLREAWETATDAQVSGGDISLAAVATRAYLVTWDGAETWTAADTPVLGLVQPTPQPVSGYPGTWYALATPGTAGFFERRDRYPVAKGTLALVRLVDESMSPVPGYTVSQSPAQDWFEVSGGREAPFYAVQPGWYPGNAPPAGKGWSFQLPTTAADSYSLGTDIIASSVIVVRNGVATTAFRFDAASGTLRFDVPVFDTDLVEISYQRTKTADKASDLVLWQGGRWDFGSSLEWALQGRWNMEKNRYTTQDLQSPGRMALSLSYAGGAGEWTWTAAATGGALLSDSTGHRRLFEGHDGDSVTLDSASLRPSALPSLGGSIPTLTESSRAALVFRDYWAYDPLTGTAEVSAWGKPGIDREPEKTDGWMGPYLVRGDGLRDDRLAVLEADMTAGQWAGAQVYFDKGAARDLRSVSSVSVNVRLPQGLDGAKVFLQAGSLSDNFDGTGSVRAVEYRSYPSLAFYDQVRGRRYFPMPEGSSWGNDTGDGSAGADGDLVTKELTSSLNDIDQWQTVEVPLNDTDRQRLNRTTGWRLIVYQNTAPSQTSRTVLVGPVVFEGSAWSVTTTSTDAASYVDVVETPDTDSSKVTVRWSGRAPWTAVGRHSSLRPASYRTLSFRYRLATGTDATLSVGLQDADRGLNATWLASADGVWKTVNIDLVHKTMTVDGASTGTVTLKSGASALDRLVLSQSGAPAGLLELSEIEAVDPIWEALGTTAATATWRQSVPWPAEFPLVSGAVWTVSSLHNGLTDDATWRGETTFSGTLGPVRASGEASFLRTADDVEPHGAYEATLPLSLYEVRVEWTDRFSDYGIRSERLAWSFPWLGQWTLQAGAKGPPSTLEQDYAASWAATVPGLPSWNAGLSAHWLQSSPAHLPLTGFGELWKDSWNWLRPLEQASFHLVEAQAETRGDAGPVSWSLKNQNHVSQSLGPENKWTPWATWEVRTPLRFSEDWSLTPSVSKSQEGVFTGVAARSPEDSARQGLSWLWTSGGLETVPFGENGRTPAADANLDSVKVGSTAGLDWERRSSSDWTDLFVPQSAGAQYRTADAREGDLPYRTQEISAHGEAKGVNLFGSLGSQPLIGWYRTDVWSWAASGRWATGTREDDRSADAALTATSQLVLTVEESVGLPVTYQGRWGATPGHSLGLKPEWTLRRPADLPFELPRWLSPGAFHREWVQNLGATVNLAWDPEPSPVLRDLQISWKGSLLLSEKSELSLTTRWGQQWQNDLMVVGLEAALNLLLTF